ncbi:MAG TPA: MFS transporter [Thermodesulfovibrionales bacterium]|nr:MFS transporter [Thermodesulfovibrionales bacterium]
MKSNLAPYLQVFKSRRIGVITLLGFSSGLPLALTGGTLQAWMTTAGVDLHTIGIFSLVGLPYTLKFLWSPVMDRFVPPWLGRRRGWIILTQLCLAAGISLMAFSSPQQAPFVLAALAVAVAFSSASQDIVIDAYRTDVLRQDERGIGAAVFVMGYRIATLVSGALALILSDRIGWQNTYLLMAVVMGTGIISAFLGPEPDERVVPPGNMTEAVWGPMKEYFARDGSVLLLLVIILYKLGDAYAGTLTTPFLIRGLGFTPSEVGTINKGFGFASLIIGAMVGGTMMVKLKLFRSLLIFGMLQAVSNLSFMVLAWMGKSYAMLMFAVGFENLSGGMGTAAFVSLLMGMCNHRFTATQYALLSSLAALGRIFISPTSGYLVESIGWTSFFFVTFLVALPGLGLLCLVRNTISGLSDEG